MLRLGHGSCRAQSIYPGVGVRTAFKRVSDLLFDPREHTHESCVQEVRNCDILILIVGRRFGGKAVPQAVNLLDFSLLQGKSKAPDILQCKDSLSVTQLEVFKAIEQGIPVFAFVDSGVLHDHQTYEKNKDKPILKDIEFPNIEKQETARYLFEFINFLKLRSDNNALVAFSRLDDIRNHLLRQWAALFQRLLFEQRYKKEESRRMEFLLSQIEDIKTALFTSMSNAELKETARGAIHFRSLIEFTAGLNRRGSSLRDVLKQAVSWKELLDQFEVVEIREHEENRMFARSAVICRDGTYFLCRMPPRFIHELSRKWDDFKQLKPAGKDAVIDAILEYLELRPVHILRHCAEPYVPPAEQPQTTPEEDDTTDQKG